jgi:hypothetical protein
MKAVKYTLWAATLVVIGWALTLISCVVGSKGLDKIRVPVDGMVPGDSGAGEVLA